MFRLQTERCRGAVRYALCVHEKRQLPEGNRFTQEEILKQETMSSTACLEDLITSFTGGYTDVHAFHHEVSVKFVKEALEDPQDTSEEFSVSGKYYYLEAFDEGDVYRIHLCCMAAFRRGRVPSVVFVGESLQVAAAKLTVCLLTHAFCETPVCKMILRSDKVLYCNSCARATNHRPCRGCGCRFGLQENGMHPACRAAKRQRTV